MSGRRGLGLVRTGPQAHRKARGLGNLLSMSSCCAPASPHAPTMVRTAMSRAADTAPPCCGRSAAAPLMRPLDCSCMAARCAATRGSWRTTPDTLAAWIERAVGD